MKAFALTSADQPAAVVDLPDPELGADGVRVGVHAASVNGFDVFQASGYLVAMMPHEFPATVGRDFAGIVEAVGADRGDLAVGDRVMGFIPSTPPLHAGSFAEFVSTSSAILAPLPDGVSFEQGAAIVLAGATAWDAVDALAPRPGDVIVVAGATGGVGTFAVQLAAQRGATVVATARAGVDAAFARSLGAAETIDFTDGDVASAVLDRYPDGVQGLIDAVSRDEAFRQITTMLAAGGRVATTLGAATADALADRDVEATNIHGSPTEAKLSELAAQVADGRLQVPIQRTYPLDRAAEAIDIFQHGTRGKLVVTVP